MLLRVYKSNLATVAFVTCVTLAFARLRCIELAFAATGTQRSETRGRVAVSLCWTLLPHLT
jgi:hypothetical protein